jgi:hypothetical protein
MPHEQTSRSSCTLANGNTLAGALPTDKQLWKGNLGNFTNFYFVLGLAYDFGVCISSQDIISNRVQNHPCIKSAEEKIWLVSHASPCSSKSSGS